MLPKNPTLLLSIVNTKLRDFYSSLENLCDDLEESQDEIINILEDYGYTYSREKNQFIQK